MKVKKKLIKRKRKKKRNNRKGKTGKKKESRKRERNILTAEDGFESVSILSILFFLFPLYNSCLVGRVWSGRGRKGKWEKKVIEIEKKGRGGKTTR